MSDSWEADNSTPVDADTFQEWVRYTAESRDIDEQELLNQLVSAFWVLDEMSDVVPQQGPDEPMGHRGADAGPDRSASPDSPPRWALDSETDSVEPPHDMADRASDDTESTAPGDDADHPADQATDDTDSTAAESSSDAEIASEIRKLQTALTTQLDLVQTVGKIRRQIDDLSLDVEKQRSRQDDFTDRISDDITRLHSRVESLDAQVSERDEALAEQLEEASERADEIESTQREFEAWIDEEFDEIEGLFERLIERTDRVNGRVDDVEATVETLAAANERREELTSLRQEAIELGVSEGRCASCDAHADLSMLSEPVCPVCDDAFTGIDPGSSWNPFSHATLRTRPDPPDRPDDF